uniref:EGF-like domain-containing protein n=1 Tax=Bombyx mori TaxID=7091 RepID=A0A8R2QS72_BOMMO|nr:zonadhesin isoform X3 [Bombyx mori]
MLVLFVGLLMLISSSTATTVPRGYCYGNETFVQCKASCPTDCCPTSDSRAIIACSPPKLCKPGCVCKPNYKLLSEKNRRCVLTSDCPPVKCTRPNEVWNPCAQCLAERCGDLNSALKPNCPAQLRSYCNPQCVCANGYYRNNNDVCVPKQACPGQCPVPARCRPTCSVPNPPNCPPCKPPIENQDGCQCQPGYILSETEGKCVKIETCPNPCNANETLVSCKAGCPTDYCPTSDSRAVVACSLAYPCNPGCVCKQNYKLLSENDKRCVLTTDCPPVTCTRPNEVWNPCAQCLAERCEDLNSTSNQNCPAELRSYCRPQCVCAKGYYRNNNDVCVPKNACPGQCPVPARCRPTCSVPNPPNCPPYKPPIENVDGCQCQEGYILSETEGKCVKIETCPSPCNANETLVSCKAVCPADYCPTSDSRAVAACARPYPCSPGCVCKQNYKLLSENDKRCVLTTDCPPVTCTRPNEVWNPCAQCLAERCEDLNSTSNQNCPAELRSYCRPQCVCAKGYYRNNNDVCVPKNACPGQCPVPARCRPTCSVPNPPNCPPYKPPIENVDGCQCQEGYILSETEGKCVKIETCPSPCNANETLVSCKAGCPADYCPTSDSRAVAACARPYPCNPGCVCKQNYKLLSENDKRCVLTTDCPPVTCTRPNEVWNPCAQCLAERCEDLNSTSNQNCPAELRSYCRPQCVCAKGYYRNNNDVCVPKNACPGQCPVPARCRPTCSVPNPPNCPPYKPPTENVDGCQCQEGYILSETEGKCVKIETCPSPCNANETLVSCKAGCPADYCPTSDSRAVAACARPYPCSPGCVCKQNYKLLSENDKRCVLATDCPPVTCTRPNEVWNPCAQCLAERCEDLNSTSNQNCPAELRSYCRPQCVCAKGYYRNNNDVCVPKNACPGQCPVPARCRPTCSVPNPPNCPPYKPPTENVDGCQCQEGYILSETEGKCVKIETCPSPCNANETLVSCKAGCPADYCPTSDSRAVAACARPYPCSPGCVCKQNYKLLSENDKRCVLTTDCPPVTCTRPNEVWNPCAQCLAERCEDLNSTSNQNCPAELRSYCRPQCVCAKGYYRNNNDVCVPKNACPGQCPVPARCRPTCSVPNPPNCPPYKPPTENVDGCQCQEGYILSETEGKCVKIETCPSPCNANETLVSCKAGCPADYCPTSDSRAVAACARPYPCSPGCVCKQNYKLLSENDKRCVLATDCPPVTCTRPNEVWNPCAQCLAERCEDLNSTSNQNCPAELRSYCRPQCVCAKGYYRNNNDVCVPKNACPGQCPVPARCRPTCSVPNPPNCPPYKPPTENEDGCRCQEGYILSETEGKCVKIETCPSPCNANETLVSCKAGCPADYCPTSDSRAVAACARPYPCNPGCVCKQNYKLLSENDKRCVLTTDCPPVTCTRPNEVWNPCAQCLAERCEDLNSTSNQNCPAELRSYCRPQCVCAKGYYRNNNDVCVPKNACPGQCPVPARCRPTCSVPNPPNCPPYKPPIENVDGCQCQEGYILSETEGTCVKIETCPSPCNANETLVSCKTGCQTNYCPTSDSRAVVDCALPYPCNPGCVCKQNYKLLSENDKRCVLTTDCPPVTCTRPNEVWNPCAQCLAERCEDLNSTSNQNCPAELRSYCRPQCVCANGYYRNNNDVCVPKKACPGQCPVPARCRPTCSVPNPPNCPPYKPPTENEDGCRCQPGYILSETEGKCVKIETCPSPCNANETLVYCKAGCPTDYCPTSDSRAIVACSPPYPCNPGCVCKPNYRILSQDDKRCVLTTDCPPVKCTRPNEVWNPCAQCLAERCEDLNSTSDQNCPAELRSYCRPQCVCANGYYRNNNDVCVPKNACPGQCPVPAKCRPTCSVPNPPNCPPYKPPTENEDGCRCQPGYILSETEGKCVKIETCPTGQCPVPAKCRPTCSVPNPPNCPPYKQPTENEDGCRCQPGYILSETEGKCVKIETCPTGQCPVPAKCRPTCSVPNPPNCPPYKQPTENEDGCRCQPGYILSETEGKCVKIETCPSSCSGNETRVYCKAGCPTDYCPTSDSRAVIACDPPYPCNPGCVCKPNYRRLSQDDERCVLTTDCPPVKCTRPNEVWNPCTQCLAERCEDANSPSNLNCPPQLRPYCNPQCVCANGYYRNNNDVCVPKKACPGQCPVPARWRPTCSVPNPPNCPPYKPPAENKDGCQCQEGYILSEAEGKCIKIEECPRTSGCNGDPHAKVTKCPLPCPSTCKSPEAIGCKKRCDPVGCECEYGYILSDIGGKCIKPEECPGGNPCGSNGTFVKCKSRCPNDYCPVNDNRGVIICEGFPLAPCYSGCICKLNYKRRSETDRRCILSTDCPPVNCTRPNEVWCPSPPPCLQETCDDVDLPPVPCNEFIKSSPRCICKDNYFRNDSGICVCAQECRDINAPDYNRKKRDSKKLILFFN